MSYKGYTASMVFDSEDKIIVGRVLDIDDIISFHGESIAEFESNFHALIDDYLAASSELGSAPEKPASGNVMLRIAPEVHAAALEAAARSGTSLNKWAEGALGKAARKPATRAANPNEGIEIPVDALRLGRSCNEVCMNMADQANQPQGVSNRTPLSQSIH